LYDTTTWEPTCDIDAARGHQGWGFRPLDADYAADGRWIVFTTRSSSAAFLCSIYGDWNVQRPLPVAPGEASGLFSVGFSPDSAEVLVGTSDSNMYTYDLNREARTGTLRGHTDDVNTAIFPDEARYRHRRRHPPLSAMGGSHTHLRRFGGGGGGAGGRRARRCCLARTTIVSACGTAVPVHVPYVCAPSAR
jgi:WD40 repeat protein